MNNDIDFRISFDNIALQEYLIQRGQGMFRLSLPKVYQRVNQHHVGVYKFFVIFRYSMKVENFNNSALNIVKFFFLHNAKVAQENPTILLFEQM